jgi:hypothetical protein
MNAQTYEYKTVNLQGRNREFYDGFWILRLTTRATMATDTLANDGWELVNTTHNLWGYPTVLYADLRCQRLATPLQAGRSRQSCVVPCPARRDASQKREIAAHPYTVAAHTYCTPGPKFSIPRLSAL